MAYLNEKHIETKEYNEIVPDLSNYSEYNLQLDGNEISYTLYHAASKTKVVNQPSPIQSMKAIKNETEVNGFRNALKRDGVALVKFLIWLEKAVPKGGETELSIAHKLEQFRSEQPLYKGISFDTIAAYQAHGAIVHYEPTEETNVKLKPEGVLVVRQWCSISRRNDRHHPHHSSRRAHQRAETRLYIGIESPHRFGANDIP